jgi:hypothetical protein
MTDTFAIQRVRDGYLADVARRNTLIRNYQQSAAELEADNAIDTRHAEVAQVLIDQINADAEALWAPATEMDAAALVLANARIGGISASGKSGARALLLAALHDEAADIADVTVVEGKQDALVTGHPLMTSRSGRAAG